MTGVCAHAATCFIDLLGLYAWHRFHRDASASSSSERRLHRAVRCAPFLGTQHSGLACGAVHSHPTARALPWRMGCAFAQPTTRGLQKLPSRRWLRKCGT